MKNHSAKKLFLSAFLVLVVTNFIVLLGVYSNRSGEPERQLILTERELQAPYRISEENSGLFLTIVWRSLGEKNELYRFTNWHTPGWLDAEKLKSLGFDIDAYSKKTYDDRHAYSRVKECFVVLEFNGETYRTHLKEALETLQSNPENKTTQNLYKREEERVEALQNYDTRLYAVDAGIDPQTLKEKYADGSKYIITKAQIRVSFTPGSKEVYGYLSRLSVSKVHVPHNFRQVIDPILHFTHKKGTSFRRDDTTTTHPPRYQVTIAYGKRYEPWIISIEPYKESTK